MISKNIDTSNKFECHNYFNGPTKLFSDLYVIKFLDTSAKSFRIAIFKTWDKIEVKDIQICPSRTTSHDNVRMSLKWIVIDWMVT